ncbi:MAG: RHS repeat domain-containing protein [Pseudomonadota bacterium]
MKCTNLGTHCQDQYFEKAIKPLLQETVYEYDAGGNRTAVVDAKGQRIEYDYDARNRMTSESRVQENRMHGLMREG